MLETGSPDLATSMTPSTRHDPLITYENLEWIKNAMEANRRAQINMSENVSPDATIDSDQATELAR